MRYAAQTTPTALHQSLIGGQAPHLGLIGGQAPHLGLIGGQAPHLGLIGGPSSNAAPTRSLAAALNPDYTATIRGFQREALKVLEPFNRKMGRQLADIAKMSVGQIVNDATVMAPFRELMDRQLAETMSKLAPLAHQVVFQMPAVPMPINLQQQLAELTGLAELATGLVPGIVAEKIELVSQVANAQPRTPTDIFTYIERCILLIGFVMAVIQFCVTMNQQPAVGGTVNQTINNSPTQITNNTTIIQPPAPIVALTP